MNPRIGINVVLVLLLARENRNDVAAETGLSYASNSSRKRFSKMHGRWIMYFPYRRWCERTRWGPTPTAPAWRG